MRYDATHKLTSLLVSQFGIITIEDLNVNGMLKNHTLARHVADATFGEIRRQLVYRSALHGNTLHIIARFFPSSKMCSGCGAIKGDLNLTNRTYICERCGMIKDRDLNAAINLNTVGRAHPEPTPVCVSARRQVRTYLRQATCLPSAQAGMTALFQCHT